MFKKLKSFIAILLVATFIMPQNILAYSKYIVAGGDNIGLQINSKGIIIVGFYNINNVNPGLNAKLNKGDIITKVDNQEVFSIDDFILSIKNSNQKNINIEYNRGSVNGNTVLNLESENGVIKTGLYVKDMISGIGTLTYIDPNTKLYGALGHEVFDNASGVMIEVKDGKIYDSTVIGIDKSTRGNPGSKNANIDSNNIYGNINENTKYGIFGTYTKDLGENKLYEVAQYKDIKSGPAKIITVLNDNEKKEYDINILKINNNTDDNKNILFEITDEELLNKAGGIIQGMSGSPIIQDDKIIGAVTNVVVNNPKRGYAILITTMLKEAEN